MEVHRLFEIPEHQLRRHPKTECIATKEGGSWRSWSTAEVVEMADRLARGLIALGIRPGDRIAVASGNRSEWCLIDQAILRAGAINVPIYPTSSVEDYGYVLQHSESRICFCSNTDILAKARAAQKASPPLEHLFTFDRIDGERHWSELQDLGDPVPAAELQQRKDGVKRADLATIIYTSGTTGRPKGVMLSHDNILSNVEASAHRLPVDHNARAISFLPLCHIYERMLMYLYLYTGVSIHFQESMDDLGERIREVRPDVFTAVPRVLEKVYARILAKGEELTGVKRKLFFWALDLGLRYDVNSRDPWYNAQLALARRLVFSKWRAALGGQVRCVASGSAALQPRLARVFNAAGIPLMEGYGLTETSPVVSVNDARNDGFRIGSVGRPLENVQVRIAADGEILVKGPNVMMGYYLEPELTRDVLEPDGWFHTGDIGEITTEGFLRITDRKKEIFKTSGGKYVAPQMIENKLKTSRFIEQVMVIGENRKFPAALIVPNFEFLKDYCALKAIPFTDREQVVGDKRIVDRLLKEVDTVNQGLGHWEQVKKIIVLPREFSIDSGELTPTLKLRRKPILARYAERIDALYGDR